MAQRLIIDIDTDKLTRLLGLVASPVNKEAVDDVVERIHTFEPPLSSSALLLEVICAAIALADPTTPYAA